MAEAVQVLRRNRVGTRSEDMYAWNDVELDDIDSVNSLNLYIQQMLRKDHTNITELVAVPEGTSEHAWVAEHLRIIASQMSQLLVGLYDVVDPKVNMSVNGEQYLLPGPEGAVSCTALEYCTVTLNSFCNVLNSNTTFPSRHSVKESAFKQLLNPCRRVHRIFAFAYFHHREVYEDVEAQMLLCARFTALCKTYKLIPPKLLSIPGL